MDPGAAGRARAGERAAPARPGLTATLRLGVSFSPRRAHARGLDWRAAYRRVLDMGLSPLRLSTYWDEVDRAGYDDLDWQLQEADRSGREVALTVGMKAQGWPEFAIPERLRPAAAPAGSNIAAADPALGRAALELIQTTVERYRDLGSVVAWQVENEPLNRSGPHRWWIGPELLRAEIAAVRHADAARPIVLNVFAAFNRPLDVASSRHGPLRLLGADAWLPEAETLALLGPGDVLGLDVYRRIGHRRLGRRWVTTSRGWRANVARWVARAAATGRQAWVVEAQAEPWEPAGGGDEPARTCRPEDVVETVRGLSGAGCDTVLLWGVEHWLAAEKRGDATWLRAVHSLLEDR